LYMGLCKNSNSSSGESSPTTNETVTLEPISTTNGTFTFEPTTKPARQDASPFSGMLANNPEMMIEFLQMNPKMKALMERNPQIRHALSDPSTLKEILATGSDPRVYQEAMRGHDRALANIENIPGGFQALQQFYTKELAEVESGLGEMHLNQRFYEAGHERTTKPMPNPWKRGGTSTASLDYEAKYEEQLERMREMGFTDTQENIRALLASGGNVDSAIEKILGNRYL
jgi:hypothetical protein